MDPDDWNYESQQSQVIYETHEGGYDKAAEELRIKNETRVSKWESKIYGWVTHNNTERARIEGDNLISTWEGHSYFIDESNTNMEYKISLPNGI